MKHKSFLFKDVIVNYQVEGEGEKTIVLLHGFLMSLDVWATYVFKFSKKIRVITIDLLGHGETNSLSNEHSMELQAELVKELLDHLDVETCVIAGHSMGGYVALAFAALYPSYVKGLSLINSHALADSEEARENRLRTCELVEQNRAKYILNFISKLFAKESQEPLRYEIRDTQDRAILTKKEGVVAAQKGMMSRVSRLDVLINADYPILFFIGKQDSRISVENILAQATLPKHSEIVLLEYVGHMAHVEADMLVKERLLEFTNTCYENQIRIF